MPGVFRCNQLAEDIEGLLPTYPSIEQDVKYMENLLGSGWVPSARCLEFIPSLVWRTEIQISAFEGRSAIDRCTIVYERDGTDCHIWLLFDNDRYRYDDLITQVTERRGSAC